MHLLIFHPSSSGEKQNKNRMVRIATMFMCVCSGRGGTAVTIITDNGFLHIHSFKFTRMSLDLTEVKELHLHSADIQRGLYLFGPGFLGRWTTIWRILERKVCGGVVVYSGRLRSLTDREACCWKGIWLLLAHSLPKWHLPCRLQENCPLTVFISMPVWTHLGLSLSLCVYKCLWWI